MSSKSKRKPKALRSVGTPVQELQAEMNFSANAFHLIANANFPGNQAGRVVDALKWIDGKHLSAVNELKAIAPELFEKKPEDVPAPEPEASPAPEPEPAEEPA